MRLYSNLPGRQNRLQKVWLDAISEERLPERSAPRLRMKRLDARAVAELIDATGVGRRSKTWHNDLASTAPPSPAFSDATTFSFGRSACHRASSVTPPGSTGRAGHWRSSETNSASMT